MTEVFQFANLDRLADTVAAHLVSRINDTLAKEALFTLVLSGGSTPRRIHKVIGDRYANAVDWSRVHVFWGDERNVPPDHVDSNYLMAEQTLLNAIPLPPENVHRIRAELGAEAAAKAYEQTMRSFFAGAVMPTFDIVFLGMGEDGHTASLFPGTSALGESDRWVVANHVPQLDTWRITLTRPVLNSAKQIFVLVAGASKAEMLRNVLSGDDPKALYPIQTIQPDSGRKFWYVDADAARLLKDPQGTDDNI